MYHIPEPTREHSINIWLVYINHNLIDTIFCKNNCDKTTVRDNLIKQDGYPVEITIEKG